MQQQKINCDNIISNIKYFFVYKNYLYCYATTQDPEELDDIFEWVIMPLDDDELEFITLIDSDIFGDPKSLHPTIETLAIPLYKYDT